jgi:hypothetical protein
LCTSAPRAFLNSSTWTGHELRVRVQLWSRGGRDVLLMFMVVACCIASTKRRRSPRISLVMSVHQRQPCESHQASARVSKDTHRSPAREAALHSRVSADPAY